VAARSCRFPLVASAEGQAGDERKQLAFDAVDRNAEQMTAISDSIFYFGEPGMPGIEGTKLLKGTLEAAVPGRLGGAGMPPTCGPNGAPAGPMIAIVTEIDALPSGLADAARIRRKPAGGGAPRPHGGPQHPCGVASTAAFAVSR